MSISLLENEKILKVTCPHPLSMLNLYLNWLYIVCMGVAFIAMREHIEEWIYYLPLGEKFATQLFFSVWAGCLLLPSLILSFYRINWSWLGLAFLLIITGGISTHYHQQIAAAIQDFLHSSYYLHLISVFIYKYFPVPISSEQLFASKELANHILMLVGFIGLCASNAYRKGHKYYLTNRRILAHFGFVGIKERDTMYSKVDDMIIQQGVLGRIFKFGTIIPISASGMGTGSDHAFASMGIEGKLPLGPTMSVSIGGGRSVTIPRAPSFYSLYGVPEPEIVKAIMLKEMEQREYGHTRRRKIAEMEQQLANMKDQLD
ncbi:PH domain-containing protein [Candidatus Uabimicrobium sp. HlEnr_7]|uniref:PH domain-containing protein n=1 Tax=Candidatus Uabimicrobium helgolandensis TaxID=3095367 RepID=UPI003558088A